MSVLVPHETVHLDAHAFVDRLYMVVLFGERDLVGTVQILRFERSRAVTKVDSSGHRSEATVYVRVGSCLSILFVGELILLKVQYPAFDGQMKVMRLTTMEKRSYFSPDISAKTMPKA